jgi:hypothetical protein
MKTGWRRFAGQVALTFVATCFVAACRRDETPSSAPSIAPAPIDAGSKADARTSSPPPAIEPTKPKLRALSEDEIAGLQGVFVQARCDPSNMDPDLEAVATCVGTDPGWLINLSEHFWDSVSPFEMSAGWVVVVYEWNVEGDPPRFFPRQHTWFYWLPKDADLGSQLPLITQTSYGAAHGQPCGDGNSICIVSGSGQARSFEFRGSEFHRVAWPRDEPKSVATMHWPPCVEDYREEDASKVFELPDGHTLELVPGRCEDADRMNPYVRAVVRGPGDNAASFFVSTGGRCHPRFRYPHLSCGGIKFTWTNSGFVATKSESAPWSSLD